MKCGDEYLDFVKGLLYSMRIKQRSMHSPTTLEMGARDAAVGVSREEANYSSAAVSGQVT